MSAPTHMGLSLTFDITPWWWESGLHRRAITAGLEKAIAEAMAAGLTATSVFEVHLSHRGLAVTMPMPAGETTLSLEKRREQLRFVVTQAGEPWVPPDADCRRYQPGKLTR